MCSPLRTTPYTSVLIRTALPAVSALRNALRQPTDHTAMCYKNTKAHGTHCTKCQSSDKSDKSDKSDILCPQYWHCAMCPCQPGGMCFVFFRR